MSSAQQTKQAERQSSGSRVSPLAGRPASRDMLVDLERLEKEYFDRKPDLENANHFVAFGTSGHRGTSLNGTFTEAHVLAITQAICDYRGHNAAVHGEGHARFVRACSAHRLGSSSRE
jgi:succinate dehydrogenase/fumarate reductase-like Fe-S protein